MTVNVNVLTNVNVLANVNVRAEMLRTALAELENEPNCFFDLKKSGARLAWEFFHPDEEPPKLIAYVEDCDLWNWKLTNSREFSTAMEMTPQEFSHWNELLKDEIVEKHIERGRLLLDYKTKLVNDISEKACPRQWMGKRALVVNSAIFASNVGNVLAKRADCDFAVIWNFSHEKKILCRKSQK